MNSNRLPRPQQQNMQQIQALVQQIDIIVQQKMLDQPTYLKDYGQLVKKLNTILNDNTLVREQSEFQKTLEMLQIFIDTLQQLSSFQLPLEVNMFIFGNLVGPLPIYKLRTHAKNSIKPYQVIESATGSGKSLLYPLMLLQKQDFEKTFVTQPSRLHANNAISTINSIARHPIAFNMQNKSVRSGIIICTPIELVKRLIKQPDLIPTSRFILDEFHERRTEQDVLFAMLMNKKAEITQPAQIILMSATPDENIVKKLGLNDHFKTEGARPYKVTQISRKADNIQNANSKLPADIFQEVLVNMATGKTAKGNILCFSSGKKECESIISTVNSQKIQNVRFQDLSFSRKCKNIQEVHEFLREQLQHTKQNLLVVPVLFAGKATAIEKDFAAKPLPNDFKDKCIKAIVATNIAETSITIDNLSTLIDTGLYKESVYDEQKGINKLTEKRISQSSRQQRIGRVGRVCEGTAYLIELDGEQMNTIPEIERVELSQKILSIKSIGVDIQGLNPYLPSPINKDKLNSIIRFLQQQKLLDEQTKITEAGKRIALYDTLSLQQAIVIDRLRSNNQEIEFYIALITQLLINQEKELIEDMTSEYVQQFYCEESDLVTLFQCFRDILQNLLHEDAQHVKQFKNNNRVNSKNMTGMLFSIQQILIKQKVINNEEDIIITQRFLLNKIINIQTSRILNSLDYYLAELTRVKEQTKIGSGIKFICTFNYISHVNLSPRLLFDIQNKLYNVNEQAYLHYFGRIGSNLPDSHKFVYFCDISYNESYNMFIGKYIHRAANTKSPNFKTVYSLSISDKCAFNTPYFRLLSAIYFQSKNIICKMYGDSYKKEFDSIFKHVYIAKAEQNKFYFCNNMLQLNDQQVNNIKQCVQHLLTVSSWSPYSLVTKYNQEINIMFTLNQERDIIPEMFLDTDKFAYRLTSESLDYFIGSFKQQNIQNCHLSLVIDSSNLPNDDCAFNYLTNVNRQDNIHKVSEVFQVTNDKKILPQLIVLSKVAIPQLINLQLKWSSPQFAQYFSQYAEDSFKFQLIKNRCGKAIQAYLQYELMFLKSDQQIMLIPSDSCQLQYVLNITSTTSKDNEKFNKIIAPYNKEYKEKANQLNKQFQDPNNNKNNIIQQQKTLKDNHQNQVQLVEQQCQIKCYQLNAGINELFDVLLQQQIKPTNPSQIWVQTVQATKSQSQLNKEALEAVLRQYFEQKDIFIRYNSGFSSLVTNSIKATDQNIQKQLEQKLQCKIYCLPCVNFKFSKANKKIEEAIKHLGCFIQNDNTDKKEQQKVSVRTTEAALTFLNKARDLTMETPSEIVPFRYRFNKTVKDYFNQLAKQYKYNFELQTAGFQGNEQHIQQFVERIRAGKIVIDLPVDIIPFYGIPIDEIKGIVGGDKLTKIDYAKRQIECRKVRFDELKNKVDELLEKYSQDILCLGVCDAPKRSQNAISYYSKDQPIQSQCFCVECIKECIEQELEKGTDRINIVNDISPLGQLFVALCITDNQLCKNTYAIIQSAVNSALKKTNNFKQCTKCNNVIVKNSINKTYQCLKCQLLWCNECVQWQKSYHHCQGVVLPPGCKRCPGCNVISMKIDGCNHVCCLQCGKHWCFQCGAGPFNSGNEVYSHMSASH